jgi:hypothetical protein
MPDVRYLAGFDIVMGLDTEYQELLVNDVPELHILSYQYTAVLRVGPGQYTLVENILYTKSPLRCDRLSYDDILHDMLKRFGIGRRRARGMRVLVLSHFGVAEWGAMRDREAIARAHLTAVRGVPVTFKDMPLRVVDGHDNSATLEVQLRDTGLLSPQGKAKLEDLAETTLHKKLALTAWEKAHMADLRSKDPERFAAYAIGDTRVTLEYYVSFMRTYAELFPNVDALPLTLGDASVKAYIAYLNDHTLLSPETVLVRCHS